MNQSPYKVTKCFGQNFFWLHIWRHFSRRFIFLSKYRFVLCKGEDLPIRVVCFFLFVCLFVFPFRASRAIACCCFYLFVSFLFFLLFFYILAFVGFFIERAMKNRFTGGSDAVLTHLISHLCVCVCVCVVAAAAAAAADQKMRAPSAAVTFTVIGRPHRRRQPLAP